jgi:hypothetical protein
MNIQRIGSTEGLKDLYGVGVLPLISLTVVHKGLVSTCGVTAEPTGDIREQTRKVLERIDWLLEKARHQQIETPDRPSMAGALGGF